MDLKKITYFSENEDVAIKLLTELGYKKTVARVLVYLIANPASTIVDIERGADLRQSEVSVATAYLSEKGWLTCYVARKGVTKGRPVKIFQLVKPVAEIIKSMEEEKTEEYRVLFLKIRALRHLACGRPISIAMS